jgi:hypothetical protein
VSYVKKSLQHYIATDIKIMSVEIYGEFKSANSIKQILHVPGIVAFIRLSKVSLEYAPGNTNARWQMG